MKFNHDERIATVSLSVNQVSIICMGLEYYLEEVEDGKLAGKIQDLGSELWGIIETTSEYYGDELSPDEEDEKCLSS